jgi:4-amino-4-deoxy-L-arabinose transferase-like glycosyltransferase
MEFSWSRRVSDRPYAYLLMAIALAAAIRLFLLWQYYCISSDGVRYIEAAENFYAGQIRMGLSSLCPPLYPLMIAALYPLVENWELAGQILSMVAGVIVLVPLFALLRKIYNENVAVIASFLAAMAPFLARYSVHVRTESPFILLSTVALLLFHCGVKNRLRSRLFCGGLIAGLAYLVRPEGIGFLVIIPIALLVEWWFRKTVSLGAVLLGSLLTLLGFLVFAGPYAGYLAVDTGDWGAVSRKTNITLWHGFRDSGLLGDDDLAAIIGPGSPGIIEIFLSNPIVYIKKIALDLPLSLGVYLEAVYYSYVPFLVLGIFHALRQRFWEQTDLLLFIFVVFHIISFAVILVNLRYAIQLIPASLGWVAMGIIWCVNSDYLRQRLSPSTFRTTLTVVGLIFIGGTLGKTLQPIALDKAYVREAGRYLSKMKEDGNLKIAVLDNRIPFYAGAEAVYLFEVKDSELRTYIDKQTPHFLAAEKKSWQHHFPSAAERPEDFGLFLEKEFIGVRKDRLLVFKVN